MENQEKKAKEKKKFEDLSLFEQEHRTMALFDRHLKRLPREARSRVLDYMLRVMEEDLPIPGSPPVERKSQVSLPFEATVDDGGP